MTGLGIYLVFALSVGLWSCYELLRPAISGLGVEDPLRVNKVSAYIAMLFIGSVFAPLFVVIILVPNLEKAAIEGMQGKRQ